MKHTPQQLEEMLNAWEDHQPRTQQTYQSEKPAASSPPTPQGSNPITDFKAGISPITVFTGR